MNELEKFKVRESDSGKKGAYDYRVYSRDYELTNLYQHIAEQQQGEHILKDSRFRGATALWVHKTNGEVIKVDMKTEEGIYGRISDEQKKINESFKKARRERFETRSCQRLFD